MNALAASGTTVAMLVSICGNCEFAALKLSAPVAGVISPVKMVSLSVSSLMPPLWRLISPS